MKKLLLPLLAVGLLNACTGLPSTKPNNAVVLINVFEVPKGQEVAALESWKQSRDFLKTQDGFISTRLHQNIDPNGKYHLINVAQWASPEQFRAATQKMQRQFGDTMPQGTKMQPGLFKVIETE